MPENQITISVQLTKSEAWNLAQFIKRVSFNTVLRHTDGGDSKEEAYSMLHSLNLVANGLAEKGIYPR